MRTSVLCVIAFSVLCVPWPTRADPPAATERALVGYWELDPRITGFAARQRLVDEWHDCFAEGVALSATREHMILLARAVRSDEEAFTMRLSLLQTGGYALKAIKVYHELILPEASKRFTATQEGSWHLDQGEVVLVPKTTSVSPVSWSDGACLLGEPLRCASAGKYLVAVQTPSGKRGVLPCPLGQLVFPALFRRVP